MLTIVRWGFDLLNLECLIVGGFSQDKEVVVFPDKHSGPEGTPVRTVTLKCPTFCYCVAASLLNIRYPS